MGENKVWFIKQVHPLYEEHWWCTRDCTRLSGEQDLAVGLYMLNCMLKILRKGSYSLNCRSPPMYSCEHPARATGLGDAVSCSTPPLASWSIRLLLASWLNCTGRTCVSQTSPQPFGYDCVLSLTRGGKGAHESAWFWVCSFLCFHIAKISNLPPVR